VSCGFLLFLEYVFALFIGKMYAQMFLRLNANVGCNIALLMVRLLRYLHIALQRLLSPNFYIHLASAGCKVNLYI